MEKMVLVNLVTKEGKVIPLGMADSYENAEKLIEYADRVIGPQKTGEYQIVSFPDDRIVL